MLFHFRESFESLLPIWTSFRPITVAGGYGVDLFFILSGVILCYRYEASFATVDRTSYQRFLIYRLARIYPVHIAALAVIGIGLAAAKAANIDINGSYSASSLVGSMLLIDVWSPRAKNFGWNYPAWSISAEWFAYLVFPFAAGFTAKVRTRGVAVGAVVVALASYLLLIPGLDLTWPLLRIATEFAAGVFIAHLLHDQNTSRRSQAVFAALIGITTAVFALDGRPQSGLLVVAFALLIYGLSSDEGLVARALSRSWIVLLGEASYALYMTHAIVEMFGTRAIAFEDHVDSALPVRVGIVLAYLAAMAISTAAMFLIVERPGRRVVRRLGDRLSRSVKV